MQVVHLNVCQAKITLIRFAVCAFARLAHQHIDGGIGGTGGHIGFVDQPPGRVAVLVAVRHGNLRNRILNRGDFFLDHHAVFLIRFGVLAVIVVQPCLAGDGVPGVFQALLHAGFVARVALAAALAAHNGTACAHAVQGDFLTLQRQGVVGVLQQNKALGGSAAGKGGVADLAFGHFGGGSSIVVHGVFSFFNYSKSLNFQLSRQQIFGLSSSNVMGSQT